MCCGAILDTAMHDLGLARRLLLVGVAVAAIGACGQATPSSSLATLSPVTQAPPSVAEDTFEVPSFEPETDAPEPTDTDTGAPGTPACSVAELKASRGITEADADDRLTEVVLVAAGTCSVDAFPTLHLLDAGRHVLVTAGSAGSGGIDLVGGVAYTSVVRLSNWCLADPAYPVSIGIVLGDATLLVTGNSFPDEGDPPPCAHDDADPILAGTAWTQQP